MSDDDDSNFVDGFFVSDEKPKEVTVTLLEAIANDDIHAVYRLASAVENLHKNNSQYMSVNAINKPFAMRALLLCCREKCQMPCVDLTHAQRTNSMLRSVMHESNLKQLIAQNRWLPNTHGIWRHSRGGAECIIVPIFAKNVSQILMEDQINILPSQSSIEKHMSTYSRHYNHGPLRYITGLFPWKNYFGAKKMINNLKDSGKDMRWLSIWNLDFNSKLHSGNSFLWRDHQIEFVKEHVKACWKYDDKYSLVHLRSSLEENEFERLSYGFFLLSTKVMTFALKKHGKHGLSLLSDAQKTAKYPWRTGVEGWRLISKNTDEEKTVAMLKAELDQKHMKLNSDDEDETIGSEDDDEDDEEDDDEEDDEQETKIDDASTKSKSDGEIRNIQQTSMKRKNNADQDNDEKNHKIAKIIHNREETTSSDGANTHAENKDQAFNGIEYPLFTFLYQN